VLYYVFITFVHLYAQLSLCCNLQVLNLDNISLWNDSS